MRGYSNLFVFDSSKAQQTDAETTYKHVQIKASSTSTSKTVLKYNTGVEILSMSPHQGWMEVSL